LRNTEILEPLCADDALEPAQIVTPAVWILLLVLHILPPAFRRRSHGLLVCRAPLFSQCGYPSITLCGGETFMVSSMPKLAMIFMVE